MSFYQSKISKNKIPKSKNYQKLVNSAKNIFKSKLQQNADLILKLSKVNSKLGLNYLNKNLFKSFLASCLSLVMVSLSIFQFYKPVSLLAAFSPQGEIKLNCSFGSGWAFDPDNRVANVGILVFKGGPFGVGTQILSTSADKNAKEYGVNSPALKQATGVDNRYGFFFYLPSSVRNNQAQNFWIYALDASGDPGTLLGNQSLTCPSGDATISGNSGGFPLTIKTTDRLAGAIDSLTWNGKEFVNSYDHGRQLQYMWQKNGLGECYNPTEAGTYLDDTGPNSTSILNYINKPSANTLVTGNFPGYWARPATPSFFCTGATNAVNTDLATPDYFAKQVQIGHGNLANVVKFNASINVTKPFDRLFIETPASFLDSSLTRMWRYNPKTSNLVEQFEEAKYQTSIFSYRRIETTPPILSTPDGKYAVGAWAAGANKNRHITYSLLKYPNADPKQASNIISISNNEDAVPVGNLNYESFLIVGTLDSVKASMNALYAANPVDTQLPDGSFDGANCQQAFGWAWDPKAPNTSIDVELYKVDASDVETILGRTKANLYNQGVQNLVTGDNGLHTFVFPIPQALKNGQEHRLYARAINTNPALVNPHIQGMSKITCPATVSSSLTNPRLISPSISLMSSSDPLVSSSVSNLVNSSSNSSLNSQSLSNNSQSSSPIISNSQNSNPEPSFSLPSLPSFSSSSISNSSSATLSQNSSQKPNIPGLPNSDLPQSYQISSSISSSILESSLQSNSSNTVNSAIFPPISANSSQSNPSQQAISSSSISSLVNNSSMNQISSQNSSQNYSSNNLNQSTSSSFNQSNFSSSAISSTNSQSNSSSNTSSSADNLEAFLIEQNSVVFSPSTGKASIFGDSDLVLNLQNLSFVPVFCEIKARPYGSQSAWTILNSTISNGVCTATLPKKAQTSLNWDFKINLKTQNGSNFGMNPSYSFLLGSFGSVGMSAMPLGN